MKNADGAELSVERERATDSLSLRDPSLDAPFKVSSCRVVECEERKLISRERESVLLFMPEWGNEIIKLEAAAAAMACVICGREANNVLDVRIPRLKMVRLTLLCRCDNFFSLNPILLGIRIWISARLVDRKAGFTQPLRE